MLYTHLIAYTLYCNTQYTTANATRIASLRHGTKEEWDKQLAVKAKFRQTERKASLDLRQQILLRQQQLEEKEKEAARLKREKQLRYQRELKTQLDMIQRRTFEDYASKFMDSLYFYVLCSALCILYMTDTVDSVFSFFECQTI